MHHALIPVRLTQRLLGAEAGGAVGLGKLIRMVLGDPLVFLPERHGDFRMVMIGEPIGGQLFAVLRQAAVILKGGGGFSRVIQQAVEELLFPVQHGAPGPAQEHLRALHQAQERQHPDTAFRPAVLPERAGNKFDAPHGPVKFRRPLPKNGEGVSRGRQPGLPEKFQLFFMLLPFLLLVFVFS